MFSIKVKDAFGDIDNYIESQFVLTEYGFDIITPYNTTEYGDESQPCNFTLEKSNNIIKITIE